MAEGSTSFDCVPETLPVDVLLRLLASNAIFDFRFSKNESSAGEFLGDSYTLGIAGTGGTSSPSAFVGAWRFRAFGAGNLELEADWGIRGWIEPVEDRTVLKLFVEFMESPEL